MSRFASTCAVAVRLGVLLACLGTGCGLLDNEGVITVRLRNEDVSGIYLRRGVFEETYYSPDSDRDFLDPGGIRHLNITMQDAQIRASFTVYAEQTEGNVKRYGLVWLGTCISRLDSDVLRNNTPEVVWTGFELECRGWF